MNTTDLHEIKSFLLEQKSYILNKSLEFKNEQMKSAGPVSDESEQASQDISNSVSIHIHERERLALLKIEKTLSKIADGSFGECESCWDSIQPKRLKVAPFSQLCIACQEEHEDRRLN